MTKPFNAAAADLFRSRPDLRSFKWLDPASPEVDPASEAEVVRDFLATTLFAGRPSKKVRIGVGRPAGKGTCPISTEIVWN